MQAIRQEQAGLGTNERASGGEQVIATAVLIVSVLLALGLGIGLYLGAQTPFTTEDSNGSKNATLVGSSEGVGELSFHTCPRSFTSSGKSAHNGNAQLQGGAQ